MMNDSVADLQKNCFQQHTKQTLHNKDCANIFVKFSILRSIKTYPFHIASVKGPALMLMQCCISQLEGPILCNNTILRQMKSTLLWSIYLFAEAKLTKMAQSFTTDDK